MQRAGTGSVVAAHVAGALTRTLIEEALTSLDREQCEILVALHYCRVPVNALAL